jgi:hypothetical protein
MYSLKTFAEDYRKEKRDRNERNIKAFSLALTTLFIVYYILSNGLVK